jgi:hypothetical protein
MNTARRFSAGDGTQTAAFGAAGYVTAVDASSEEWDGTNWTATSNVNVARGRVAGVGTTSAGLIFGGQPTNSATESWNGSSWSTAPALSTARHGMAGAGTSPTAVGFGGSTGSPVVNTEEYNNVVTIRSVDTS